MSNGRHPAVDEIEIHLENVTYGQFRKFLKLVGTPEQDDYLHDEILSRVVPDGIDHLPFLEGQALITRITTLIQESMLGKAKPAEPSSVASDAAALTTSATNP